MKHITQIFTSLLLIISLGATAQNGYFFNSDLADTCEISGSRWGNALTTNGLYYSGVDTNWINYYRNINGGGVGYGIAVVSDSSMYFMTYDSTLGDWIVKWRSTTAFDINKQLEIGSILDTAYGVRLPFMPNATCLATDANGKIVIGAGGGEVATLDSLPWTYNGSLPTDVILRHINKNVGIGISTPSYKLDVLGNFNVVKESANGIYQVGFSVDADNMGGAPIVTVANNTSTGERTQFEQNYNYVGFFWDNGNSETNSIVANAGGLLLNSGAFDNNVGIGTQSPVSKLTVSQGDIYITDIGSGVISKSPNGSCWRSTVDNSGNTVNTLITCP